MVGIARQRRRGHVPVPVRAIVVRRVHREVAVLVEARVRSVARIRRRRFQRVIAHVPAVADVEQRLRVDRPRETHVVVGFGRRLDHGGFNRVVRVCAPPGDVVLVPLVEPFELDVGAGGPVDLPDVARILFARERPVETSRAIRPLEILHAPEEPQLVLHDRAAELRRRVPIRVDLARLEVCAQILGKASRVVADPAVALGQVLEQSREPVGARADDAVGGGAGELAVLRVGAEPDHLHFLDPVVVEERPGRAAIGIADVDAIDQQGVRARGAAVRDAVGNAGR